MSEHRMRQMGRRAVGMLVVATIALAAGSAAAEDSGGPDGPRPAEVPDLEGKSFEELAERLAELRSEVDSLSSKVDQKKQRMKSRLRSLQQQRSEVELEIEKTRSQVERLRRSVRDKRESIEQHETAADELKPAVARALETVRESVRAGPPFKRRERLEELDDLEEQLNEDLLSPQKTASRLWQFVEDELRLGAESGMYRQVVELDGEQVLADVARVGMVMLYFRTDDGRVGVARRGEEGWRWHPIEREAARKRIDELFASFDRGISVGFFTLPNGLPGIERYDEETR